MNKFTRWLFSCLAVSLFILGIGLIQPSLFDSPTVADSGKSMSIVSADPDCIPHRAVPSVVRAAALGCGVVHPSEIVYEDYVVGNTHHFVVWERQQGYGADKWTGWTLELNKNDAKIQMCWHYHQNENARVQCLIDFLPLADYWQGSWKLDQINVPGQADMYCNHASVNANQTKLWQRVCRENGDWMRSVRIENGVIEWGKATNWRQMSMIPPSKF